MATSKKTPPPTWPKPIAERPNTAPADPELTLPIAENDNDFLPDEDNFFEAPAYEPKVDGEGP